LTVSQDQVVGSIKIECQEIGQSTKNTHKPCQSYCGNYLPVSITLKVGKQKARQVPNLVGLDGRHGSPAVGCVDGGENLDLPTRAAWMSLIRVMRAKISQGRALMLELLFWQVNQKS